MNSHWMHPVNIAHGLCYTQRDVHGRDGIHIVPFGSEEEPYYGTPWSTLSDKIGMQGDRMMHGASDQKYEVLGWQLRIKDK